MRLQRLGNEFIGSHSSDGTTWSVHADTGVVPGIPADLLVGMAVSSHNNGVNTVADLTGFALSGSRIGITYDGSGHVTVSWPDACTRLQGTGTLIGNAGNNSVWVDIPGASPVTVTSPGIRFFRTISP